MIICLTMEYKRSTFKIGLQARNVKKLEKNRNNGSYCIVHLKTGKMSITTMRKQTGDDKR